VCSPELFASRAQAAPRAPKLHQPSLNRCVAVLPGAHSSPSVVFGVRVSGTLPPRESRVPRLNAVTRQRGSLCPPNTLSRRDVENCTRDSPGECAPQNIRAARECCGATWIANLDRFAGEDTGATAMEREVCRNPRHQGAVGPRAFGSPMISFQPPSGWRRSTSMALERSSIVFPEGSTVVPSKSV
jgi:hypothetical protein